MFGNQPLLNRIILEKKDNPIYPEKDNSVLKIIEVLYDEQWKELGRQYQFCEDIIIAVPHLGRFIIDNSALRKYIRDGVKKIRKLRARIEILSQDPKFDPANSMTALMEKDLVLKVRASWTQLDKLRHVWLKKNKNWKEKKKSIKA